MTEDRNDSQLAENIRMLLSTRDPEVPMPRTTRARILAALHARPFQKSPSPGTALDTRRTIVTNRILRTSLAASLLAFLFAGGTALALIIRMESTSIAVDSSTNSSTIEKRLQTIEDRLGYLDWLKEEMARRSPAAHDVISVAADPAGPEKDGASADGAAADEEHEARAAQVAAARIRSKGGEDGLRSYIARVVEEQRAEREVEMKRQAEERRQEMAAFQEGPYGQYNYKVNSMAKRLSLSDRQKGFFYATLLDYNGRINASREQEAADAQNAQVYRDQRKELRKEFGSVVTQNLTPQQAELFKALAEPEQRPDASATGDLMFTSHVILGGAGGEGSVKEIHIEGIGPGAGGGVFMDPVDGIGILPPPPQPTPAAGGGPAGVKVEVKELGEKKSAP